MSGEYIINVLEPKSWDTGDFSDTEDSPNTFRCRTKLSQHISFLASISGYATKLRHAIKMDDLVTMRRYRNIAHYLESFENAATKIRAAEQLRQPIKQCEFRSVSAPRQSAAEQKAPPFSQITDDHSVGCPQPEPEADEQQNIGLLLTLF